MAEMSGKISIAIISVSIVISLAIFASVTSTPTVLAAGENITTNVTVSNVAPTVGAITCNPSSLTPTAGTNTTVSCWATLSDDNGYGDINQSKLVTNFWYNETKTETSDDDLNDHYSNGSASNAGTDCTWTDASGTDITVNCSYTTRYYIDPTVSPNVWTVKFVVNDTSDGTGNNETTYTVDSFLGLDVKETSIEYGTVDLGATSLEQITNITNWCNQLIDVDLRESEYSGELYCPDTDTNITTDAASTGIRFNETSGFAFVNGTELTGTSTTFTAFDLDYYNATGTTDGESANGLYWLLKVPDTGVGGTCSGKTEFVAAAG